MDNKYNKTSNSYLKPRIHLDSSENLLEKVLADAKPIISSDKNYSVHERPSELSSYGGYSDWSGDDPSN